MTVLDRVFEYIGIISTVLFIIFLVLVAAGGAKVKVTKDDEKGKKE